MFYTKNQNYTQTVYNPTTNSNPFKKLATLALLGIIAVSALATPKASAAYENCRTSCTVFLNVTRECGWWNGWDCDASGEYFLCTSVSDSCSTKKTKRDKFLLGYISASPYGDLYLNYDKYSQDCSNLCKPFF